VNKDFQNTRKTLNSSDCEKCFAAYHSSGVTKSHCNVQPIVSQIICSLYVFIRHIKQLA